MKKDIHDSSVEEFFQAVLSLKTVEECYAFFEDLCTPTEVLSIAQRYQVGEMLMNKATYKEISGVTGASTTTISRVNRLLSDDRRGIEMAVERTQEKKDDSK